MSFAPYRTIEEVRAWLESPADPRQRIWGIIWKETRDPVGSIGLHLTEEHGGGNLSYILRRDFWGRGIATEAARLDLAFFPCGIDRVFCRHAVENDASRRVIEKLGFVVSGEGCYGKADESRTFVSKEYFLTKDRWEQVRSGQAD